MNGEEPSRVLHFRNVTSEVTQQDLQTLAAPFGRVENIVMLRNKNQALLQMETLQGAIDLVNTYPSGYTEVAGRRVYVKYSRHSELKEKTTNKGPILLVSMSNPHYDIRSVIPITADFLYQVFNPYGRVLKIVVVSKQTTDGRTQALVQFDNVITAEQAKAILQGQNVYVGTQWYFTLDLQFSNLSDLTVRQQSQTAMVYEGPTTTSPAAPPMPPPAQKALPPESRGYPPHGGIPAQQGLPHGGLLDQDVLAGSIAGRLNPHQHLQAQAAAAFHHQQMAAQHAPPQQQYAPPLHRPRYIVPTPNYGNPAARYVQPRQ